MSKKSDIFKWGVIVILLAVIIFLLAKDSDTPTTTESIANSEAPQLEPINEETPAVKVDEEQDGEVAEVVEQKKAIQPPTPQRDLIAYVQNNYSKLIDAAVDGDNQVVQKIDSDMAALITKSETIARLSNATSTNSGTVVTIDGFVVDGELAPINTKVLLTNYSDEIKDGDELKLYPTGMVDSSSGTTLMIFAADPLTAYRMSCAFLNAQIEKAISEDQAKQADAQRLIDAQQAVADAQQAARDAQAAAERAEESAKDRDDDNDYYGYGYNTVVVRGWGASLPSYRPSTKPKPSTSHSSHSGGSRSVLGNN